MEREVIPIMSKNGSGAVVRRNGECSNRLLKSLCFECGGRGRGRGTGRVVRNDGGAGGGIGSRRAERLPCRRRCSHFSICCSIDLRCRPLSVIELRRRLRGRLTGSEAMGRERGCVAAKRTISKSLRLFEIFYDSLGRWSRRRLAIQPFPSPIFVKCRREQPSNRNVQLWTRPRRGMVSFSRCPSQLHADSCTVRHAAYESRRDQSEESLEYQNAMRNSLNSGRTDRDLLRDGPQDCTRTSSPSPLSIRSQSALPRRISSHWRLLGNMTTVSSTGPPSPSRLLVTTLTQRRNSNIKGFMIQTGDPTGTGKGGQSIYDAPFADEIRGTLKVSLSCPFNPFRMRCLLAF